MSPSKNSSKVLFVVVLLFIVMVLIKSYFALAFVNPTVMPDEVVYSDLAKNLVVGKLTSDVQFAASPPPGYPFFLSLADVSSSADRVYHLMLIINCILSSSIIFPAFFILKKFIEEEKALYFSAVVASLPSAVVYFPLLLSENLFVPLFLFSAWFMLESVSRKSFLFDFLFGFSVFLLFLTRPMGIVTISGIVLAVVYKIKIQDRRTYDTALKSSSIMLLSFLLPFGAWYLYKINNVVPQLSMKEFSDVSGYGIEAYLSTLISALSTLPSSIKFLGFFINEIDYLALVTYSAFLIFAVYSIYKLKSIHNENDYRVFVSYTLLSAILFLVITTVHMYIAGTTEFHRDVLGRYIDPIVAPLFIMGVVGFYQFRKDNDSQLLLDRYLLAGLYILVLLVFVLTFPVNISFMQAHLLSVAYLSIFGPSTPIFFTIASLLIFSYILLMPRNQMSLNLLLIMLVCASLLISSFTIAAFYPTPNEREDSYRIARYLQKYASSNTLTLFDSKELDDTQSFVWYPINFWSRTQLRLYTLNDSNACPAIKAEYIVSNKTLSYPYENVTSDGTYNLYSIDCG